ncbi:hypothetical protein B484DRAFT_457193 [Ochromonadaceae sp. CCMP2298]|nr:hypothetical protein B484DRAFT_457193 [Ochromonadaceae sp. CCMP2298]|mmetsp:Transcript_7701/g.17267  ORF Transcript_7701/g.17267 Transcript_7701/m.17267 type:complete len:287 (-) Transcript_7701:96-956(-)
MEFDNVGRHCQVGDCKQKDFLPFICDCCGKSLCMQHRSYDLHSCSGSRVKDMTSVDCPVCGKSVKFDKSQDPNRVWDEHYVNQCTQQASQQKKACCFKGSCNTVLGPSNTFTCSKCHQKVCLAHRIAEEHNCVGPVRREFLANFQKLDEPKKVPAKNFFQLDSIRKNKKGADADNSLRGTTHMRMQRLADGLESAAPRASGHSCPFCTLSVESEDAVMAHISAFHPESANDALNREVCPTCHQRFGDATSLVAHFESSHPQGSTRPAEGTCSSSGGNNGGFHCRIT